MKDKIIYLVLIVVVLLGAYWAYTKFLVEDVPVGGVTVTGFEDFDLGMADEATKQSYEFIKILQNTDEVTLDNLDILSSDIFQNKLKDFGKPINDRPVGRANPFAPATGVSNLSQPVASTTTTNGSDLPLGDDLGAIVE
ncbi:MAG TPA: hypothetical protein P5274_02340, partial [Candidatus Paceibacterota bacterium]|nr:hypothetical protein [Candidatus Paceibacterota bacterium]